MRHFQPVTIVKPQTAQVETIETVLVLSRGFLEMLLLIRDVFGIDWESKA